MSLVLVSNNPYHTKHREADAEYHRYVMGSASIGQAISAVIAGADAEISVRRGPMRPKASKGKNRRLQAQNARQSGHAVSDPLFEAITV